MNPYINLGCWTFCAFYFACENALAGGFMSLWVLR